MAVDLKNKTAVVVGGGTGIGQAIARALAAAGVKVAIGGRREEVLKETAAGTSILWQMVDVGNRAQVNEFFAWANEQLGSVDILINAAGINIKNRAIDAMLPEQWDELINVNATGAYNCIVAVLPGMRARKSGTIINVSSIAGKRAISLGGVAYSASKFAMTALSTCVSNEVAGDGVRVTNLYPGEVNTPLLDQRPVPVTEEHKARILKPEEVAEFVVSIVALPPSVHIPEVVIKPFRNNGLIAPSHRQRSVCSPRPRYSGGEGLGVRGRAKPVAQCPKHVAYAITLRASSNSRCIAANHIKHHSVRVLPAMRAPHPPTPLPCEYTGARGSNVRFAHSE